MFAFKSGIIAIQRNDDARVQEVKDMLRRRAPDRSTDSLLYSLGQRLEAEIAFRDGRYEDSIELFSASDLQPTWLYASYPMFNMIPERIRVAQSYIALGRDREAVQILEALGDGLWNTGVHTYQTTAYIGRVFLMRAEIYDRQARTDRAIKYYTRFLETWWDPEPELQPLVDEARARLDELVLRQTREPNS
jgi:tetratricopeptide (TPR) repeat protein